VKRPALKRQTLLAYAALLGGILCLTFSGIFVRTAHAPGLVTSFFRMAVAAIVLTPVGLSQIRRLGRIPPLQVLGLGLLAGLFSALDHGMWSTALGSTSVANATLFNYIAPLWVALFAVLAWREKLGLWFWAGLAMVLGGMGLVIGSNLNGAFQLNPGDTIAVGSSVFYAAYFLTAQRGRAQMPTLIFIWLVAVGAALALLCACLAFKLPLWGYEPETYLIFLAAGLFSQVAGYFLVAYTLGHLPASIVAPTMIAQPVLSALLAIPMFHEPLSLAQALGGLAVLAGIYVVNQSRAEATPPKTGS
jgi:drug/metabolite transporter (DMT)-like permease